MFLRTEGPGEVDVVGRFISTAKFAMAMSEGRSSEGQPGAFEQVLLPILLGDLTMAQTEDYAYGIRGQARSNIRESVDHLGL